VTGFNTGGAETQGPITSVSWLIRKDGEAGSYSLRIIQTDLYIHIFNKDVTNVETSLVSEYMFIHKIRSIMQDET